MREELPDDGGTVQRGDPPQPTPQWAHASTSVAKDDTSPRRGARRASCWESGSRESSAGQRGRGRAGLRHLDSRYHRGLRDSPPAGAGPRRAARRSTPAAASRPRPPARRACDRADARHARTAPPASGAPLRAPGRPSRSSSPNEELCAQPVSDRAAPSPLDDDRHQGHNDGGERGQARDRGPIDPPPCGHERAIQIGPLAGVDSSDHGRPWRGCALGIVACTRSRNFSRRSSGVSHSIKLNYRTSKWSFVPLCPVQMTGRPSAIAKPASK